MNILMLTEYFPDPSEPIFTGGVETRTFQLSHYLSRRGHQVRVVRRTGRYEFNSPVALMGRLTFFLKHLAGLLALKYRVDIVEGTNFVTYMLAFLYARRTGAKSIAWYPDVFMGTAIRRLGLVSGSVAELAERSAVRLPWDGIIALSVETRKKLIKAGVDGKKIMVIYGGVDIEHYMKVQKGIKKFKHPTILCVARLVQYKRVRDLLLAVYFLRERLDALRVIIVGDGPERNNLIRLSTQLGIYHLIHWLKELTELKKMRMLARSHVHVLASEVEGFGLVTMEALASGTPVVNTDIPINREVLQGEKGGLLYASGDCAALAECIEMLLTDTNLYNQKVLEGKNLVRRYDWNIVNRQTESFYQYLLSH